MKWPNIEWNTFLQFPCFIPNQTSATTPLNTLTEWICSCILSLDNRVMKLNEV